MRLLKIAVLLMIIFYTSFFISSASAQIADKSSEMNNTLSHVVKTVLNNKLEGKRVYINEEILDGSVDIWSWHDVIFTTPSSGWLVFIDDMALANFEHPCRYVFVNQTTKEISIWDATTPPLGIETFHEMPTEAKQISDKAYEIIPEPYPGPPRFTGLRNGGHAYAVIISGGANSGNNHIRYYNDVVFIYTTLKEVYGFADADIFVLMSDGTDPAVDRSDGTNSPPDLDGDGTDDIDFPAEMWAVNDVFNTLGMTITVDDQIFFFFTDHGGTSGGTNVHLNLWNLQTMSDATFANLVNALPSAKFIFTMEQCFSGGFMDDLTNLPNHVFASACASDESSWAMDSLLYDEFVYYWISAVRGQNPQGSPVNADIDGDGEISIEEAFIYAEDHDTKQETPQYDEDPVAFGANRSLSMPVCEYVGYHIPHIVNFHGDEYSWINGEWEQIYDHAIRMSEYDTECWVYYHFILPHQPTEDNYENYLREGSLKVGVESLDWAFLVWLGPTFAIYDNVTEDYENFCTDCNSQDDLEWGWWSPPSTDSNRYVNDNGELWLRFHVPWDRHTVVDDVRIRFEAADESIYSATPSNRDDCCGDGQPDGVDVAIDADVGHSGAGATVDVTAFASLTAPGGGTVTDSATWSITDWDVEYGTVQLSACGATENGDYTVHIDLYDDAGNLEDEDEFQVTLSPYCVPSIGRSPSSLSNSCPYGANASSQTFEVWNGDTGTLSYSISDDAGWLSCSPTSGTSTGEHDTITVSYSTSGLSCGNHTATITITDPQATNNPQSIQVDMEVICVPSICRSPTSLANACEEGENAPSQTFDVWNCGDGTLNYSISDDAGWLSCNPTSGSSTGEHDTITVNYSTSGLACGTHNATITISDPNADNNPQTIPVTLSVNCQPSLCVSPTALTNECLEGQDATSQTFDVWNCGAATLTYTITDDAGWLSCSPGSGSSSGEHDVITVTYSTAGLACGSYAATITVTSPEADNSPQTIPVNLTIHCIPVICVDQDPLDILCYEGDPCGSSFEIWNCGTGILTYIIDDDAAWLECTPTSGDSTGEHDTITVNVTGLGPGTYTATITITAPGAPNSPYSLPVNLTIRKIYFTIGGNIYTDLENPDTSGLEGVLVTVDGYSGPFTTYTAGIDGAWQIENVHEGTYTVNAEYVDYCFEQVIDGVPGSTPPITIEVDEANEPANQEIEFLTGLCCLGFDMNYDGMVTIIGDVEPLVDCLYRDDCYCPGPGCECPGDCNGDEMFNIIGDVPCFVDCLYYDDCNWQPGGSRTTAGTGIQEFDGSFTIGGAVYTDLDQPLMSGLEEVTIQIFDLQGSDNQPVAVTTSRMGLWRIDGLSSGTYAIKPVKSGYLFENVDGGMPNGSDSITIVVDRDQMESNGSIKFLGF